MPEDARTYDFLEGGGPLEYKPQAPDMTPDQIARAKTGRALFDRGVQAAKDAATAVINSAQYRDDRADDLRVAYDHMHDVATADWNLKGTGAWNFKGQDWGLLPAAAVVVQSAITLAATGGLAAPAVALEWGKAKSEWDKLKNVDSIGDIKQLTTNAKRTLEKGKAFIATDLKGDDLVAAYAAADNVLGNPAVTNAKEIVANTIALAETGNIDAQRGAVILAKVAGARAAERLPMGTPLIPLLTPERVALVAHVLPQTVYDLSTQDILKVSDVRQSWWKRLINWLEHL